MPLDQIIMVTSADFQRNIGLYQDEALKKPLAVTMNGRPRTVLISAGNCSPGFGIELTG